MAHQTHTWHMAYNFVCLNTEEIKNQVFDQCCHYCYSFSVRFKSSLGSLKKLEDFLIKNSVFTLREIMHLATDIWEVANDFAKRTRTTREEILYPAISKVNQSTFSKFRKINRKAQRNIFFSVKIIEPNWIPIHRRSRQIYTLNILRMSILSWRLRLGLAQVLACWFFFCQFFFSRWRRRWRLSQDNKSS